MKISTTLSTPALLAALSLSSAQAGTPDGEAFVAAFGEVCIPERWFHGRVS